MWRSLEIISRERTQGTQSQGAAVEVETADLTQRREGRRVSQTWRLGIWLAALRLCALALFYTPPVGYAYFVTADSLDFILDTTGALSGAGGLAWADSADFALDTTGAMPGAGGLAQA